MKHTLQSIAARFGCTVQQVRDQYTANAAQLRSMERKARERGRKVNGYTADQLATHAADFEARACAS